MAHSGGMLYSYCPTLPDHVETIRLANGEAPPLPGGGPGWWGDLEGLMGPHGLGTDDYVVLYEPQSDWSGVVLPEKLEADIYQVTEGRRFRRAIPGIVRCRTITNFAGLRGAPTVTGNAACGTLLGSVTGGNWPMPNTKPEIPEDSYWLGQFYENRGLIHSAVMEYRKASGDGNWSEHRYAALRRLAAIGADSREESQRLWLEAIRLCPLRREAYVELAENYELNKELNLAQVMAEAALRCKDEDQVGWIVDTESGLRAHDTMSIILSRTGEYEGAMHHGQIAVELGEQRIRNNLAYWRRKLDDAQSPPAATPEAEPSPSLETGPTGSPSL
jgi:hypothetical protein